MKKWLFRSIIAGVVLVVLIVGGVLFFLNDIVKTGFERVGPAVTKVDMRLKAAAISPFSGNAHLTGIFVGNPQGYKTESAMKVGDVKVVLSVASALSDTVLIESIKVKAPEITFEGGLTGNNLSKILENVEAAAGGKSTDPATNAATAKKFRVKDVVVEGGRIHISTLGQNLTVPLPPVHLQNIGTDGEGVNAAELTRQIIKPLLASATRAATEALAKDINVKTATERVDKATKGIKGLLGK
jgi:uncharacterized protein involved in outer membrane biogenesis